MTQKIGVIVVILAPLTILSSYIIYNNYDKSAELHPIIKLDNSYAPAVNKNILELETAIAEILLNKEEEASLRNNFLNFGTRLDRISFSTDQTEEKEWEDIILLMKNSFPNSDTEKITAVLRCYGAYRLKVNRLEKNTTQALTIDDTFTLRYNFFGKTWSHTLFDVEFNMLFENDSPKETIDNPIKAPFCELLR